MKSIELTHIYGVPVYRRWEEVPVKYCSKTEAKRLGVTIPDDAKPDAIKNSSSALSKDKIYKLYDIEKYG